jgi:signal transduction histidine kinase
MPPGNDVIPNNRPKLFAFGRLPIQRRLPVFICILLLAIVFIFSWLSYLGVRNASMAMANELPVASYRKTADLYLGWIFITGGMTVAVGTVGGWIISRGIIRRLYELNRAIEAIAEGDYSVRVNVHSSDEAGHLAASFNRMAVRINDTREDLEQMVEKIARQLQTALTDINDQRENEMKKDEFISIASHELRTPLTIIKAFFQITVKDMDPAFRSYNLIGKAARQLNRMERLIGDLLDVSRINAGKMQYNEEAFDFQQLLKDAVDNVQQIFPHHQMVIENQVSVMLHGDRHRIEQVIINLLNNAVKYSPGADEVLIRAGMNGHNLVVTIEDFGIGIDESHIGELFDRFYRVDGSHNYQGLGLGLFISSEIIKRHRGSISVKSEPGKGSAFTFQLPVASSN